MIALRLCREQKSNFTLWITWCYDSAGTAFLCRERKPDNQTEARSFYASKCCLADFAGRVLKPPIGDEDKGPTATTLVQRGILVYSERRTSYGSSEHFLSLDFEAETMRRAGSQSSDSYFRPPSPPTTRCSAWPKATSSFHAD